MSSICQWPGIRRTERTQPAAAVAMSDADGLKAFNDKFGMKRAMLCSRQKPRR